MRLITLINNADKEIIIDLDKHRDAPKGNLSNGASTLFGLVLFGFMMFAIFWCVQ